jgi:phosphatidylglycerol:prolipoprotein diacylglycerol transferase
VVSRRTQRPLGLSKGQQLAIGLGAFCGGMLAAKLPFVLLDWEGFLSGTAWFDSGKTLVMGLVGGYFGVEAAKWSLHIRTRTGDSFAAPVAVAIAVGRLACFSAGCCHGTVTDLPWGVDFGDGLRRHPTQLYESGFHAACAVILLQLQSRQLLRGQLIKLYIIAYLCYRFATEYIRPEPKLALGLSAYQWAALLFVPLFAGLWLRDSRALAAEQAASQQATSSADLPD